MHAFTGTGRLIRLALRLDRIKLPVVILALLGILWPSVASIIEIYAPSAEERMVYAATTAPSIVSRVFGGPVSGPDIGAIVMNEMFLFTAVAVAFMCSLTVVRHTRQNEETGRAELIESGVVSRHAPLVAALVVACGASLVFGLLFSLTMIANDLPVSGSIGAGVAMSLVGVTFAAVAAVAAQLADSARGANGLAALAIGVAFLLRAIGDGTGKLVGNGMAVESTFPSWLSPFGWAQQVHAYTEANWWLFGLFAVLIVSLIGLAVSLMSRRDIGLGMISTRPGPDRAAPGLLSPFGLARRLQFGILRGWAVAVFVLSVTYGVVIKEFENLLTENEELRAAFEQFPGSPSDAFIGVMVNFMAITIAGYAVQALMRMRAEEASGQLESILGTGVSRSRWLLSHVGYVLMGVAILALITGFSMGGAFVLSTGEPWSEMMSIVSAALVQSTAVFSIVGLVIAVFAFKPGWSVPLAWGGFSACLIVMQLGVILKLPQWVQNLSPFGHLPAMPAEPFAWAPVIGLLIAAGLLGGLGLYAFRKRDIVTT